MGASLRKGQTATVTPYTQGGGQKGQIPPKDLRDIMDVVTFNHKLLCDEWCKRFQGDISFYE